MPSSAPRIDTQQTPQGEQLVVLGAWTAADLTVKPAWDALALQLKALEKPADAAWAVLQAEAFVEAMKNLFLSNLE